MELSEDSYSGNTINAIDEGRITVNHRVFTTSLLLTPNRIEELPQIHQASQLEASLIEKLKSLNVDVFILGTGKEHYFPDQAFYDSFYLNGIGVEVMPTPAACRTYNILMSELRNVAAILIL